MKNFEKSSVIQSVTDIFGEENIKTAFITGGIAAGTQTETSDVDIFVCHNGRINQKARGDFIDYYMNLHEELGRIPDEVSPGEIMSCNQLETGLSRVYDMKPTEVILGRDDFDYICWAGMLVSKKDLLIASTPELVSYENFSRLVMIKWIKGLYGNIKTTYATGCETDSDKILARKLSCPGYYDVHK